LNQCWTPSSPSSSSLTSIHCHQTCEHTWLENFANLFCEYNYRSQGRSKFKKCFNVFALKVINIGGKLAQILEFKVDD
jgi:hypothetical protein